MPAAMQAVDEVDVEVEAGLVELARAGGLDAGPRDREPVGLQAEVLHDRDVLRRPGGSGRPRRRRCRRRAPCRACGRTCPRWTGRGRPRRTHPRSGTRRWPSPRGSRRGTGVRRGARSSCAGPSVGRTGRRSGAALQARAATSGRRRADRSIGLARDVESIRYTPWERSRHRPSRGGAAGARSERRARRSRRPGRASTAARRPPTCTRPRPVGAPRLDADRRRRRA